jgi:phosphoglycolate phosphatase
MLEDLGLPSVDALTVRGWVGDGASALVSTALTHAQAAGATDPNEAAKNGEQHAMAMERFLHHYMQNLTECSVLYDGVLQTLETLKHLGLALGCVTNKPEQFTRPLLRHFSLDTLFSSIVGGDSLARRKPDPAPLLHAAGELGSSRAQTVMVGDSANDVLAARRAGMRVVCVSYGYNRGDDVTRLGATAVIKRFPDVLAHL